MNWKTSLKDFSSICFYLIMAIVSIVAVGIAIVIALFTFPLTAIFLWAILVPHGIFIYAFLLATILVISAFIRD